MGKQTTTKTLFFVDQAAGVDAKVYKLSSSGGELNLEALSDDLQTLLQIIEIERNGIATIDGMTLFTQLGLVSDQADTVAVLKLEATGANGARADHFVGTRDPNGNVTGNTGDYYTRVAAVAADTKLYQLRAASGNTGWVDVGAVPLPWVATISGAGPFALVKNAINLYDDTAADAFTMNLPASPRDGDEVWLCEIGGSRNPVTLSGNGNNVTEWATLNEAGASVILASEGLIVGYKFFGPGSVWKRIVDIQDQDWTPRNAVSAAITLRTNEIQKYDGAATFTISLPATPVKGTIIGVAEHLGSGAGVVTVSGNGTNLVNDAGASAASMTLSTAYAYRQWRYDNQADIWLRTHPAI